MNNSIDESLVYGLVVILGLEVGVNVAFVLVLLLVPRQLLLQAIPCNTKSCTKAC